MRQTLTEWLIPATIALFGLIFVADYSLGWPASRTWPVALILWGVFRVAAGLVDVFLLQVDDDDGGPGFVQPATDRLADPSCRPRDDRDALFEFHSAISPDPAPRGD